MAYPPPNGSSSQQPDYANFDTHSVAGAGAWINPETTSSASRRAQRQFISAQRSTPVWQGFSGNDPPPNAAPRAIPQWPRPTVTPSSATRPPNNVLPQSPPPSQLPLRPNAANFAPQSSNIGGSSQQASQAFYQDNRKYALQQYNSPQTASLPYCPYPEPSSNGPQWPNATGPLGYNFQSQYPAGANNYGVSTTVPQQALLGSSLPTTQQQPGYLTPPYSTQATRPRFIAPLTTQNLVQGGSDTSMPTQRLIRETYTDEDPNWATSRLQVSTLPLDTTPTKQPTASVSHSDSQHSCNYSNCNKRFDTRSGLNQHERNHWSQDKRPIQCEFCHVGFLYPKDYNRHCLGKGHLKKAQQTHSGEIYYCPVQHCRYNRRGFERRDHCNRHIQIHEGHENMNPIVVNLPLLAGSSSSQNVS